MQQVKEWIAKPFDTNMDAIHWFLFVGLLIFVMVLWRFILAHMKGAIA
jgi:hypothetical protein